MAGQKNSVSSGILTCIIGVEGKDADHFAVSIGSALILKVLLSLLRQQSLLLNQFFVTFQKKKKNYLRAGAGTIKPH